MSVILEQIGCVDMLAAGADDSARQGPKMPTVLVEEDMGCSEKVL